MNFCLRWQYHVSPYRFICCLISETVYEKMNRSYSFILIVAHSIESEKKRNSRISNVHNCSNETENKWTEWTGESTNQHRKRKKNMLNKQHWRLAHCCWRNKSHACVNSPSLSCAALLALKSVDLLLQFGSAKNLVCLLLSIGQEVREPLLFCASHSLQVRITLLKSGYLENYYVRQRKVIALSISNCYLFFSSVCLFRIEHNSWKIALALYIAFVCLLFDRANGIRWNVAFFYVFAVCTQERVRKFRSTKQSRFTRFQ